MLKVIDIATTSQGAFRLLRSRVNKINTTGKCLNYIACPENTALGLVDGKFDMIPIEVNRELGFFKVFEELQSIKRILIKIRPHIIHTHNSKAGALGRIAAFLVNVNSKDKIKVIHQVHGYYHNCLKGIKRIVFLLIEYLLAFITDALLFQNRFEYRQSRRYKMHYFCELIYIGNGINFEEFQPADKPCLQIADNGFNFICIARIEPVKNHRMLIRALDYLAGELQFKRFTCYFIGEITDTAIIKYAQTTRAAPYLQFCGPVSRQELLIHLHKAYLSFLTSLKEGKPRSIMESMLFGVPCLVTDAIGTNELVLDGKTGFLIKLGDYRSLAEKIRHLCEKRELREEMSTNCRVYAQENFNENKVVNSLLNIYQAMHKGENLVETKQEINLNGK